MKSVFSDGWLHRIGCGANHWKFSARNFELRVNFLQSHVLRDSITAATSMQWVQQ